MTTNQKLALEAIERKFGRNWRDCFVPEVQQALVAEQALLQFLGASPFVKDAAQLEKVLVTIREVLQANRN